MSAHGARVAERGCFESFSEARGWPGVESGQYIALHCDRHCHLYTFALFMMHESFVNDVHIQQQTLQAWTCLVTNSLCPASALDS